MKTRIKEVVLNELDNIDLPVVLSTKINVWDDFYKKTLHSLLSENVLTEREMLQKNYTNNF
jgi:hypothetical protein